jgi:hypothetical protein
MGRPVGVCAGLSTVLPLELGDNIVTVYVNGVPPNRKLTYQVPKDN